MTAPLTVPTLRGEGVGLRPFRGDDVGAVLDATTDPSIPLVTTVPSTPDLDQALAYLARQLERARTGEGCSWAVVDLDDECVGQAGLWLRERAQGRATIGYWVRPGRRRRGVATEALALVVAFAWTVPDLHRLELHVEPSNVASARAAERVGFAREGLLRGWLPVGPDRRDVHLYGLVRPA